MSTELTAREREILLKICEGASNKEIANELCISFHTVEVHVLSIFRMTQVNDRFQAVLWSARYLVTDR